MEKVNRSKSGLPTVAERGGGYTNTGDAKIIAGENGEKVKPLFVPSRGYANGEHAIFVARQGMHIVHAIKWRAGEAVTVYRVEKIGTEEDPDALVLSTVGEYENGDGNIPEFLNAAVDAALEKCSCYHCREPHYI